MNTDTLVAQFRKHVALTDDEAEEILNAFQPALVKKRQFLVQPGYVARHRNYVVDGALRAYIICYQGKEHTIQLAIDDWWISDYSSYIFQQPATMFVVAVADSQVLQLSYEREAALKARSHRYETLFRSMAERSTAFMQKRVVANLTASAEERYQSFMSRYPEMSQRIPQYAIASYLGMTTEYLSRLRNPRRG